MNLHSFDQKSTFDSQKASLDKEDIAFIKET